VKIGCAFLGPTTVFRAGFFKISPVAGGERLGVASVSMNRTCHRALITAIAAKSFCITLPAAEAHHFLRFSNQLLPTEAIDKTPKIGVDRMMGCGKIRLN